MPKVPDNQLPESWHTYFAKEANNAAWDLSESLTDTAQLTELLDIAHASAWHWRVVGQEIHRMRSEMLLALVHARLGMGPSAWSYAERVKKYFTSNADTPDWELAFTHTIHALAAHANGQLEIFENSRKAAMTSIANIATPDDREIVLKTFQLISKI